MKTQAGRKWGVGLQRADRVTKSEFLQYKMWKGEFVTLNQSHQNGCLEEGKGWEPAIEDGPFFWGLYLFLGHFWV